MRGEKMRKVKTAEKIMLTWEDPPPPRATQNGWVTEMLSELRQRKDCWALLREYESHNTANVCSSVFKKRYQEEFEFCSRKGKLYGKFVGQKGRKASSKKGESRS